MSAIMSESSSAVERRVLPASSSKAWHAELDKSPSRDMAYIFARVNSMPHPLMAEAALRPARVSGMSERRIVAKVIRM